MMGEYKFVFTNIGYKQEKSVTLSIHNQEEKEQKDYMLEKDLEINMDVDQEMQTYISEISRELNSLTINAD